MTIEVSIMWTKPAYEDLRIGFEVTMYFANRWVLKRPASSWPFCLWS